MNILFLSTHLNTGGITSYLLTLAAGLVRRGHQVHVATSGGDMEKEFLSAGARLVTLNIRAKSELDPKIYLALKPLKRYIREHHIDLIHAQTRVTQLMGAMLKRLTGKAYLSTCHGFFKTRLSRKVLPCWGDAVIAISPAVEAHLTDDFGVTRARVVYIPSGVDLEKFAGVDDVSRARCRARFNLGDAPVVGMIARFSDVKGQDILIKAMKTIIAHIPDARLLLIGEGKTEQALRGLVEDLGLAERVHFFAVVNNALEMLSLFDVAAMPSRQEGLGLSIMEAQAAGVPVVAARVGGIPSLIEDGRTGILVAPEDSEALAGAVVRILRDKKLLKDIGLAGRAFIRKTYPAQRMVDQTAALYERLVQSIDE
jgi:glycosyltransferase involved in cell wall biosynthesis